MTTCGHGRGTLEVATFLATVRYEARGHEVVIEVWLTNTRPVGQTTREEVEEALRTAAASGVAPEGWQVQAMNWSHPRSSGEGAEHLAKFDSLIRSATVTVDDNPKRPPPGEGREE